jgi:hypothetical protein
VRSVALAFVALLAIGCGDVGTKESNKRPDKVGETVVGQSLARSKDGVCMSNLSQVRQAIEVQKSMDTDSTATIDLKNLKLPANMLQCPIGKEAYELDPATGAVKCPHKGHEKY